MLTYVARMEAPKRYAKTELEHNCFAQPECVNYCEIGLPARDTTMCQASQGARTDAGPVLAISMTGTITGGHDLRQHQPHQHHQLPQHHHHHQAMLVHVWLVACSSADSFGGMASIEGSRELELLTVVKDRTLAPTTHTHEHPPNKLLWSPLTRAHKHCTSRVIVIP